MLKHILYLLIASAVIIFGQTFVEQALFGLLWVYDKVFTIFGVFFSANTAGQTIHQIVSLFLTPLVIVALPAFLIYLLKRDFNNVLIALLWAAWLATVVVLV